MDVIVNGVAFGRTKIICNLVQKPYEPNRRLSRWSYDKSRRNWENTAEFEDSEREENAHCLVLFHPNRSTKH